MNQSIPLSLILIVFVGGVAVYGLWRLIRALEGVVSALTAETAAQGIAAAAVKTASDKLDENLKKLEPHLAAVPKLIEMVAKVGAVQSAALEKLASPSSPFGKSSTATTQQRDVHQANQEYEVDMMMRAEGISRDEALLRLNPTNMTSVWDGNRIMEGWGR